MSKRKGKPDSGAAQRRRLFHTPQGGSIAGGASPRLQQGAPKRRTAASWRRRAAASAGQSSRPAAVPRPLVGASASKETAPASRPALATAAASSPTGDRSPATRKRTRHPGLRSVPGLRGFRGTDSELAGDRGSTRPGEYEQVSVTHVPWWLFRDDFLQTFPVPLNSRLLGRSFWSLGPPRRLWGSLRGRCERRRPEFDSAF